MNQILAGKKAIITGANQGLGFEIARKFVSAGADVMICARNSSLLNKAHMKLQDLATKEQKIVSEAIDVSAESNADHLVKSTLTQLGDCHILVNNAGVYGPKGESESVNWKDWMRTIEINVYGSVLMARAILPHFKAMQYGKIIQLSGGGATNPLPRISAYAASKAAIVRYAETLAEEVRGTGVDINCIAPGPLNTGMLDEILEAGPDAVGQSFYDRSLKQRISGGTPLTTASDLALFLASNHSDGITGKLISAVWDNWIEWPKYIKELSQSDVFTLRRIRGSDRGYDWGDK